ncbi:MAG TPA: pyridoxamine 5'-phosphate oxidase family protein [Dehalococcoidia bacterium]|nr:pyridoxamine 5'-phosphate oxidase family protein [Dehalococcoidia bacterium]
MNERELEFLEKNHTAAMITLRPDGAPHAVRVSVALVDGKVWSSGTPARRRTAYLRRDPRATLFVFDTGPGASWRWLTLEARVRILEGPGLPELSARLFETIQRSLDRPPGSGHLFWEGTERPLDEFLRIMREEQRLIYEFDVLRTYGMF